MSLWRSLEAISPRGQRGSFPRRWIEVAEEPRKLGSFSLGADLCRFSVHRVNAAIEMARMQERVALIRFLTGLLLVES